MDNPWNRRVMVALDVPKQQQALTIAQNLKGTGCWLKVGLELYAHEGLSIVSELKELDFKIFLDLKLHDIPNTVARTVRVLAASGADMINVHASGGYEMMARAAEAAHNEGLRTGAAPKIIGVTALTSLTEAKIREELQIHTALEEYVLSLGVLAQKAGLDGVVCSASEATTLRRELGEEFLLVTPGIRPSWSVNDDQARITAPHAAIAAGSSYLVVGRPITTAPDPRQALEGIWQ